MKNTILYQNNCMVTVQAKHGVFSYFKDDDPIGSCLFHYGEWAEQEFDVISRLINKNSNCIDIGSNIGTHTVWLSNMCHQGFIFSIEPQFYIYQILVTNIILNERLNTIPLNIGISDTDEIKHMQVRFPIENSKQNYGEFCLNDENVNGYPVQIKRLDNIYLMNLNIDFIKIDCETFETKVLNSAHNLLIRDKPHMYIEFNLAHGNDELLSTLGDYGYNCYWHVYTKHNENNWNELPYNIWAEPEVDRRDANNIVLFYESNLIAIHKDKDEGLFSDRIEKGDSLLKWLKRHDWID